MRRLLAALRRIDEHPVAELVALTVLCTIPVALLALNEGLR